MTKVTASFESQKVPVGIDIHKRSWNAAVYLNEQFIRNILQPPAPQALHHYLEQNYPRANYVCAYECGKFGYWMQREFKQLGIEMPGSKSGRYTQYT